MKPSLVFVLVLVGLSIFLTACPGPSQPQPKTFQLRVELGGEGTGVVKSDPVGIDCGDDCENTFQEDATVTLTAQAGEGSTFAGFEGCTVDANNASVCTVAMDAAKEVAATFDEETTTDGDYKLEVTIAGNGVGTVTSDVGDIDCTTGDADCTASFEDVTSVTLTATPSDANSIFTGFSGCTADATEPNKCTVQVADQAAPTSVTATFAPADADQFVLSVTKAGAGEGTVTSSPEGIDCGEDCSETFLEAASVTLTATPADADSVFDSFTNCVVGETPNVCTVEVNNADAPIEVTATFREATDPGKVLLTIDRKGNGAEQASFIVEPLGTGAGAQQYQGPTQYDPGTVLEIEARLGATSTTNFLGWSGACTGTPSGEKCTLTLDADATVTGIFSDGSEPTANGTITAISDDAEEFLGVNPNNNTFSEGDVKIDSGDLDFAYDTVAQVGILSGMRFTGIDLPGNATVVYSYIQFRADAASPADGSDTDSPDDDLPDVNLVISGENADSSATFIEGFKNISGTGRPKTEATVSWSPVRWTQGSTNPTTKQSPDVTSIVQEIASRPGWNGAGGTGGTMTFFVAPPKDENGNYVVNVQNYRQADALDDKGAGTPARLVIIYETP